MTLFCLSLLLPPAAELPPVTATLRAIESKYNRIKTLELSFEQTTVSPGRIRKVEAGQLLLRKPGRMRWQYTNPEGKLFLSDGKDVFFYSPAANRVERSRLKDAEDFRAPLAFLLGKLDFDRDFQDFRQAESGQDGRVSITALPKSGQLPYSKVQFTLALQTSTIERVVVTGQDGTIMEFAFTNERVNPSLAESVFRFVAPPGAEIVEAER